MSDPGPAISDQGLIAERDYWLTRLSTEIDPANLVLDHARPGNYRCSLAEVDITLDGEVCEKLARLTGDKPFLLLVALMTGLKICLHKYTGNSCVVVGSPARRHDSDPHQKANALPIVDEVDDRLPFSRLLLNVRQTLLDAYARQRYPFDSLVEDLGMGNMNNRCPLFRVALVLTDIHLPLPDVRQDITLTFTRKNKRVSGRVTFNSELFYRQSIERFASHLINILRRALESMDTSIGELEILTDAERRQLLVQWNHTVADYPKNKCIQHLFEDRVRSTPGAVALVFGEEEVTYETLDRRANQLARHLRSLGAGPESLVALCLERSAAMVVGLLGILKAGAAYVPLDPAYPKERLAFMLEDARAEVLLAERRVLEKLPGHNAKIVLMDSDWAHISLENTETPLVGTTAENLVYVIYTSGSTGMPKGVAVSHRSLVNTISSLVETYKLEPGDRLLQFLSPSFDAFAEELYPTLISGATLVLHPHPTALTPVELIDVIERFCITALHIPPAYAGPVVEQLSRMEPERLNRVRLFITGGESLSVEHLARLRSLGRPGLRFVNAYGTTEATITAINYELPLEGEELDRMNTVPIGRPIANTQVYLLDQGLRPMPIGAAGELHLGGICLARGYLNHHDLTAENFIPDPYSSEPGARLYRTGDRARYRPDGQIEFLGRQDNQVKMHGHRIELEEIEAVLREHPVIQEAVVQVVEDDTGLKRLVAHILPHPNYAEGTGQWKVPVTGELRSFLREKLPEHMIPLSFVVLNALPLMPNGKVDRRRLNDSGQTWPAAASGYVAPRSVTEEKLAAIWAELLRIERVGVHDNFQDSGGHSLLAFQLVSRVRDVFQLELPLSSVFESPTVTELAILITHKLTQRADQEKIKELLAHIEQLSPDEVDRVLDSA